MRQSVIQDSRDRPLTLASFGCRNTVFVTYLHPCSRNHRQVSDHSSQNIHPHMHRHFDALANTQWSKSSWYWCRTQRFWSCVAFWCFLDLFGTRLNWSGLHKCIHTYTSGLACNFLSFAICLLQTQALLALLQHLLFCISPVTLSALSAACYYLTLSLCTGDTSPTQISTRPVVCLSGYLLSISGLAVSNIIRRPV